jgi:hypothetical protein
MICSRAAACVTSGSTSWSTAPVSRRRRCTGTSLPKTTSSSPFWSYASSAGPGGWVEAEARRRGSTPEEQLLAIFDLFDEWFHREDFEACSFINVLLELGAAHPAGRASIEHLVNIRSVVRQLAEEASLSDPDAFARSWHILMKGSIVSAAEGDPNAALRAKVMARRLIEDHSHTAPVIAGLA